MTDKFISWENAVSWLKAQPDQLELVKACFYDDPLSVAAERYYTSTEWSAVQQLVETYRKGKALDIGAGRGISSYALACDGWDVTALEPDSSEVVGAGAIRALASEKKLDIAVIESQGEQLPFPDNSFNLVYLRQALHHADDLETLCQEIFRVLKPSGILLATREHVISKLSDINTFLTKHPLHKLYGGENAYSVARYRSAISGSGFESLQIIATYDSNINLFPGTVSDLKEKVEKRLRFSITDVIFKKLIIPLLNMGNGEPGRLYTFVGRKP